MVNTAFNVIDGGENNRKIEYLVALNCLKCGHVHPANTQFKADGYDWFTAWKAGKPTKNMSPNVIGDGAYASPGGIAVGKGGVYIEEVGSNVTIITDEVVIKTKKKK